MSHRASPHLAAWVLLVSGVLSSTVALGGEVVADNALTADEKAAGWRLLFDGETLQGFRNYRSSGVQAQWRAEDGTLVHQGGGGDLISEEQFSNFDLLLDWQAQLGLRSRRERRVGEEGGACGFAEPVSELPDLESALQAGGA